MDAKRLADKYIAADGGPPKSDALPIPEDKTEALACLLFFIGAHHPRDMQGGWKAEEAMKALATLTGIPEAALKRTAKWF